MISHYFKNMRLGMKFGSMAVLVAGIYTGAFGQNLWVKLSSGTKRNLSSVYFLNPSIGWVVGDSGTILKTGNSGNSWIPQSSGTTQNLSSVQFADTNNGWAVSNGGLILNTTNGGSTWTQQSSGITEPLTSVHFTDRNHGWVSSLNDAYVLKTTNGGMTWNPQLGGSESGATGWQSVYFADTNNGWVVGADNCCGIIARTINGGVTWTEPDTTRLPIILLASTYFVNDSLGWIAGLGGILKTRNAGISWVLQDTASPSFSFHSVFFSDSSDGWTVGDSGVILNTSNGGNTWTSQSSGTNVVLTSVFSSNGGNVYTTYVVGENGTILENTIVTGGDPIDIDLLPLSKHLLSLHLSPTQLSFTLPNSFSNPSTAAIYNLSGNRLIESPISKSNFSMHIGNLGMGKYFLEVKDAKDRIVEPFEISQ